MNKEQFIKLMESPSKLDEATLPLLSEVVRDFPYFQTAQIMYAKNLGNIKSIHYNNQLKIAAAYSTNRKVLFNILMREVLASNISKAEKEISNLENRQPKPGTDFHGKQVEKQNSEPQLTESLNTTDNIPEPFPLPYEEKQEINTVKTPHKDDSWENIKKDIESLLNRFETATNENLTAGKKPDPVTEESNEQNFQGEISELETDILSEAISAYISMDTVGSLELDKVSETNIIRKKEAERDTDETAMAESFDNENKTEEVSAVSTDGVHSLSEWLKLIGTTKIPEHQPAISTSGKTNPEQKLKDISSTKEKENRPSKSQENSLIDKFITEEPKIKRPAKSEFFSPVNMAKMSMVEDLTFVTETLAKIYEKQGNYTKAINAYKNLILKYPEKSTYFAARIKAIKELKDNK